MGPYKLRRPLEENFAFKMPILKAIEFALDNARLKIYYETRGRSITVPLKGELEVRNASVYVRGFIDLKRKMGGLTTDAPDEGV